RQARVVDLGGLRDRLLVPVLADVAHPECDELAHERRGVELGHDDAGDLPRVAVFRPRGLGDLRVDRGEAVGERHAVLRYLRNSGMSSSPSSSMSRSSGAPSGASGSTDQPPVSPGAAPTGTCGTSTGTKLSRRAGALR